MSDIEKNDLHEENNTSLPETENDNSPLENIDAEDTSKINEEKTPQKKNSVARAIFDYVEIFTICICVVFLVFSFVARVCRVSGSSMNNTLEDGEILIVSDLFYSPKQGDIIVFHQTSERGLNEPVVKRVIALGGQTVKIDFPNGKVYVDGVELKEDYINLDGGYYVKQYYAQYDMNFLTGVFETVVPEGELFVMGDNRNHSLDSRSNAIATVDERRILGKLIFKVG